MEVQDIPDPVEEPKAVFFDEEEKDKGDKVGAVKPFLGEVKNSVPSWYKPNKTRDNQMPKGNLQLHHIHGFRYFYILDECRDMLAWSDKS